MNEQLQKQRIAAARPYLLDIARSLAFQNDRRTDRLDDASWFETLLHAFAPGVSRDYWAIQDNARRREGADNPVSEPFQVRVTGATYTPPPVNVRVKEPPQAAPAAMSALPYYQPPAAGSAIPSTTPPAIPAPAASAAVVPPPVAAPAMRMLPYYPNLPEVGGKIPPPASGGTPSEAATGPKKSPKRKRSRIETAKAVESVYGGEEEAFSAGGSTAKGAPADGFAELVLAIKENTEQIKKLVEEMKQPKDGGAKSPQFRGPTEGKHAAGRFTSAVPHFDHQSQRGSVASGADSAMNAAMGRMAQRALTLLA